MLLPTLEIIDALLQGVCTAEELVRHTGLSDRNVKRRIDEARHLGAQIVSERRTDDEEGTNFHVYVLQNRDAILAGNFQTWLELERARGREEKPLIAER